MPSAVIRTPSTAVSVVVLRMMIAVATLTMFVVQHACSSSIVSFCFVVVSSFDSDVVDSRGRVIRTHGSDVAGRYIVQQFQDHHPNNYLFASNHSTLFQKGHTVTLPSRLNHAPVDIHGPAETIISVDDDLPIGRQQVAEVSTNVGTTIVCR